VCLFLFLFVNFAFSAKYLSDITPYYLPASIGLCGIYLAFWRFRSRVGNFTNRFRYLNHCLVLSYFAVSAILFIKIPAESLNVDRRDVITSFWDNYFNGEYVYFAQSFAGNYPGPMPFYFVLALPFYWYGELGFFSLMGLIAFVLLIRASKKSRTATTAYMLLIMVSAFFLWEVTCRSNIFLNAVLVLLSITYILQSIEAKTGRYILRTGILIGLLLSTRNVFVILISSRFCLR
jgi:succinate-acetate transporter protein